MTRSYLREIFNSRGCREALRAAEATQDSGLVDFVKRLSIERSCSPARCAYTDRHGQVYIAPTFAEAQAKARVSNGASPQTGRPSSKAGALSLPTLPSMSGRRSTKAELALTSVSRRFMEYLKGE